MLTADSLRQVTTPRHQTHHSTDDDNEYNDRQRVRGDEHDEREGYDEHEGYDKREGYNEQV
jgi:hypothetical protein